MRSLLAAILLSLIAACGEPLPPPAELGKLVVVTREGPITYQVDGSGKDFRLRTRSGGALRAGTRRRGPLHRGATISAEIAAALASGRAHLAAAALAPMESDALRFSRPIRELQQLLVQHEDALPVDDAADLADRTVAVLAGSAQIEALARLQPRPEGMRVVELEGVGEMELLERVNARTAALAAIDSAHFDIGANFFPGLYAAFELPGNRPLAWAFPKGGEEALFQRAEAFIVRVRQDGTLDRLVDRYFGHPM
jgi:membrane-bound lytic murein transglycosylase F